MEAGSPLFETSVTSSALMAPPMLEPKLTEILMLPPDPEADGPLPIATAPLVSTLAVPLLKVKALD